MEQAIQEFLKLREERVPFLGRAMIVTEVDATSSLIAEDEVEKELKASGLESHVLLYWKVFVRSVRAEEGAPPFTDADILTLARGSRGKLTALMTAVDRVNGMSGEANAKN